MKCLLLGNLFVVFFLVFSVFFFFLKNENPNIVILTFFKSWVFFLGAILNVIAAVFCDGGDSPRHRKQRPIPPRRLAKNTIAITLSGAAVFLPAFFVFCGGDGSIAGYDTCEEPISSNPFGIFCFSLLL